MVPNRSVIRGALGAGEPEWATSVPLEEHPCGDEEPSEEDQLPKGGWRMPRGPLDVNPPMSVDYDERRQRSNRHPAPLPSPHPGGEPKIRPI